MNSQDKILLGAMLGVSAPATAQVAPAALPTLAAPITANVDPARLAEGRLIAAKLLPPGIYKTLMGSVLTPLIDNMGNSLKALPLRQLAEMGGLDAEQAAGLDKVNLEQVMAIYDPHWRERTQLTTRAMFDAMGEFFTTMEPDVREAYATAYANRFTLSELQALNAFFTTPVGAKYAAQYITLATDPAIAAQTRAMMPKLMQQMPAFMGAAQKATAALPPPRKLDNLTPAERTALAKALGVRDDQLRDPKSGS